MAAPVASPEPFVAVPLWALTKALNDHRLACLRCSGANEICSDAYYAEALRDWINVAQMKRNGRPNEQRGRGPGVGDERG